MAKSKGIGIVLSDNDTTIIAWLNMLKREGESPRTWIQAILLADSLNQSIDVGTVYVSKKKQPKQGKPIPPKHMMFGDDTIDTSKKNKRSYGWNVKGKNNEYVSGNILSFSVSRATIIPVLDDIYSKCSNISSYIKAILRKYIKVTDNPESEVLPDRAVVLDLFAMNSCPKAKDEKADKTSKISQSANNKNVNQTAMVNSEPAVKDEPKKQKNPLLQYIN